MIHEPRNRLSKKIADTITFEESRINKRSVRHAPSIRHNEMLYPQQGCSDNSTDDHLEQKWITVANALSLHAPIEEDEFFKKWMSFIKPFSNETVKREEFSHVFPKLSVNDVVSGISTTNAFQRLFWPFVYEVAFMNQKLALLGLTGKEVPSRIQKSAFYAALENIQAIKIPIVERKITYSFYDTDILGSMVHYDGISNDVSANNSKKHLFNANEQREIIKKTDAALELIKETMPDLHRAINQMVGCIAFYKAEDRAHISGSMTSAIGIIWFDPSATVEWTIPFYAEQIVHEYIHTSLYVAELVHGMFSDHRKLPGAKVMSSIRLEKRDYDKSFHACYVSTGLFLTFIPKFAKGFSSYSLCLCPPSLLI